MNIEGGEDGRGRRSPVLLCPLPWSAGSKKQQLPTSTPSPPCGAELRKHLGSAMSTAGSADIKVGDIKRDLVYA
uniref:Uncharacterized protein n=1 Tax=Triticum urartu TaxID=4572 RepID=A0A8R7QNU2_TRIUA